MISFEVNKKIIAETLLRCEKINLKIISTTRFYGKSIFNSRTKKKKSRRSLIHIHFLREDRKKLNYAGTNLSVFVCVSRERENKLQETKKVIKKNL
jgi:hypothetical protein